MIVTERAGRIRIVGKEGKIRDARRPSRDLRGGPQACSKSCRQVVRDQPHALPDLYGLARGRQPRGAPRAAGLLRVASAKLSADDRKIENVKELLNAEGIAGRLAQANDGTLVVTSSIPAGLGIKSEEWPQPQQLDSLMGKVLRINADGSVPKDNPFVGRANARPEVYALGIRDDGGIAIQPKTGKLWVSEHGPRGGDEINLIEKGKNYVFPVIGYGRDYTGKPINNDKTAQAGLEQPVLWTPDIAPAGGFLYGQDVPGVGRRCVRRGARSISSACAQRRACDAEEHLLADLNTRIQRHRGPDGALYVMINRMGGRYWGS